MFSTCSEIFRNEDAFVRPCIPCLISFPRSDHPTCLVAQSIRDPSVVIQPENYSRSCSSCDHRPRFRSLIRVERGETSRTSVFALCDSQRRKMSGVAIPLWLRGWKLFFFVVLDESRILYRVYVNIYTRPIVKIDSIFAKTDTNIQHYYVGKS